jgi:membrane protease YdiL (CAAX protease family)
MKKSTLFIVITCAVSWLSAAAYYLSGASYLENGTWFGMLYMLIPAIVAIFLQKVVFKQNVMKPLLVRFKWSKWFLFAILSPVIIVFLSIGISTLMPGVSFSATAEGYFERLSASMMPSEQIEMMKAQLLSVPPIIFILASTFQAIIAGTTINAVFAFGEELGWRGFLLRGLSQMKFVKVSLIVGVVWGFWHFPLILMGHNYPQHPVAGVFMMVVFCVLFSFLFTYVTIKSKSVLAAAFIHGNLNAVAGFSIVYLKGGNDLINGITGLSGFIAIGIAILLVFLYDKYISKENIFTSRVADVIE